jgi:putative hydrolase of the HAD superfamily
MGVVSNREKPYWDKIIDLNLNPYFKFALASAEVNSYKPDRVIFEKALELAGTSAAETMYVGDNYFADIVGARRVGIIPVLYDPTDLFPDAGCATIKSFNDLPAFLK